MNFAGTILPPAGDVWNGAGGCGDGLRPAQGVDDRNQGPQVRQQVGAGAAGQARERLAPEGSRESGRAVCLVRHGR